MAFSWSYSKIKNFETCPKRHYHYDIAKDIREAESGALKAGHEMHLAFEDRLRKQKALPLGLAQHEPWITKLIEAPGDNYGEQKLAITKEFKPTAYFSNVAWFRTVIDFCKLRKSDAIIVDYKSGKPAEDETQLALMSATIFHYAQHIKRVKAALLFTSHDVLVPKSYVRSDLPLIWNEILPRVKAVEKAEATQEYPPKPSGLCVNYCGVTSCPYHGIGTMERRA